jgi:hypothetical protein
VPPSSDAPSARSTGRVLDDRGDAGDRFAAGVHEQPGRSEHVAAGEGRDSRGEEEIGPEARLQSRPRVDAADDVCVHADAGAEGVEASLDVAEVDAADVEAVCQA